MKNLKLTLLAILAVAGNAHGIEVYLNTINNQTVHKIEWEQLELPDIPEKMRPTTIDPFSTIQPHMRLIPPAILTPPRQKVRPLYPPSTLTGAKQEVRPLYPPSTLTGAKPLIFKNQNKPYQAVLLKLGLAHTVNRRGSFEGRDYRYEIQDTLYVSLQDTEGNVIKRWSQEINRHTHSSAHSTLPSRAGIYTKLRSPL